MSCLMISPKHCATLANGLAYLLNDSTAVPVPYELHNALKGCYSFARYDERRIYAELWRLNAAAYNGRYHETVREEPEPMPADFPHLLHRLPWQSGRYVLDDAFYTFIKALDCLIYQTAEDATRNSPLFIALNETVLELRGFVVNNSAAYRAAAWLF